MKVTTFYQPPEQEIEVEVSTEDIARAIAGEAETEYAVSRLINACGCTFRAIPDAIIAGMSEAKRKVIREFLAEQSARFAP